MSINRGVNETSQQLEVRRMRISKGHREQVTSKVGEMSIQNCASKPSEEHFGRRGTCQIYQLWQLVSVKWRTNVRLSNSSFDKGRFLGWWGSLKSGLQERMERGELEDES